MTLKGKFETKLETYVNTYFGVSEPQKLKTEEIRLSIDSSNSPRINGKLQLQPNTLRSLYYHIKVPPMHIVYDYQGYPFDYYISHVDNIGFYDQIADQVVELCAAKFYSRIGELKVNIAQALAERDQTIKLIGGVAKSLAQLFMAIRRGKVPKSISLLPNFRNHPRFKQYCGQKWLEYAYGWKPLLSDVYGAMIATVDRPMAMPIEVRQKIEPVIVTEEASGEFLIKRTHRLKANCTIKCNAYVDSPLAVKAHELGLDNPALLVWELIPYSFVVDWFIPIGNWIESQTALTGIGLLQPETTITTSDLCLLDVRVNPAVVPMPFRAGYFPTSGSGYKKVKRRDLYIPPIPLPTFQNPLSSISHALSAIALLGQAFWRETPWSHRGKGR